MYFLKKDPINYFQSVAGEYDANSATGIWGKIKHAELRAVTMNYNIEASHKVLDVGCGTAQIGFDVVRSGAHYFGIDASSEMVARAKQKGLDVQKMNFEIELPNEKFDRILFLGSLEFVKNQIEILKRAKKILNPKGQIWILMPRPYLPQLFYFVWKNLFHCRTYSTQKVVKQLNQLSNDESSIQVRKIPAGPLAQVISINF